jgi:hypothetical protein
MSYHGIITVFAQISLFEFLRLTLQKKVESLKAYESQSGKNYMNPDFIRSLAKVRGVQANSPYAEAFEIYRWMI